MNVDSTAQDAVSFEGMSGKIFLLAGGPSAVIKRAASGSRAIGSRPLIWIVQKCLSYHIFISLGDHSFFLFLDRVLRYFMPNNVKFKIFYLRRLEVY